MADPDLPTLANQLISQVEVPGAVAVQWETAGLNNLRPYFIAGTANPNATVHYELGLWRVSRPAKPLDPSSQNASRGAAPPGVQQRDPPAWGNQVHRNTIRDCDSEKNSGRSSDPTVDALNLDPAGTGINLHQLHTMYLVPQNHGGELRECSAEGNPPVHHLAYRCPAPETEVEVAAGLLTSSRDAGHDAKPRSPAGYLEPGNRPRERCLPNSGWSF